MRRTFLFLLVVLFFSIIFSCKGPTTPDDPIPGFTINGTYERVYDITDPNDQQPVQISFFLRGGGEGFSVNADQKRENEYSFSSSRLVATYPSGAYYEIMSLDYKVMKWDSLRHVGRKITINGYTFKNPIMDGPDEKVRCRFDENGGVHELGLME